MHAHDQPNTLPQAGAADDALKELRQTSGDALSNAAKKTVGPVEDRKVKRIIKKIDREDAMDEHLHRILVFGLYATGLLILFMIFCLGFNLAVGSNHGFLTDDQQAKLQAFLLSGVVGSGITFAGKRIAGQHEKDDK